MSVFDWMVCFRVALHFFMHFIPRLAALLGCIPWLVSRVCGCLGLVGPFISLCLFVIRLDWLGWLKRSLLMPVDGFFTSIGWLPHVLLVIGWVWATLLVAVHA
ncbi:hypothetical protein NC653_024542 [Populus alba x Populus x berolinensis]|uniref:Uncharacterized protein n=1 Tax=Populus alba x Populus x berolinensis TaxID=444605 RepID=A0AAD6Q6X7_9ROSI|nr:hypothetical protein NC653_024542 [Populus alba x Populus x berolinensis]